jgi:hypothetical protein
VVGVGAGLVVGVGLCDVVPVDRRAVVVVPRPTVVAGPEVVDGPLDVVELATVVLVDDVVVWPWTTMSLGLPAELGTPAMAMPRAMHTRRRRTMPARRAAGPCQSMAGKPNEPDFFLRQFHQNPNRRHPDRAGFQRAGHALQSRPRPSRGPFQHCSNTIADGVKPLVRRLKPPIDGATNPGLSGGAARRPRRTESQRRHRQQGWA